MTLRGGPMDDMEVLWPGNDAQLIITTTVDGKNIWHRYTADGQYQGVQTRRWGHIG